jgi:DUF4097 and DUF4098 domain-containing protein YvlB
MDLNTVTGDMTVRVAELSKARIKTTNGDVELRASKLTDDVRIDAEAINGDLRFRFRARSTPNSTSRPSTATSTTASARSRTRPANTARAMRCASRKATATGASASRR